MNSYNTALLKVHITAVLFGLTGVLGVLIESKADVLVLGRLLTAFPALSLFLLLRREKIQRPNAVTALIQCGLGALLVSHWVTFYIAVKVGGVAVGTLGFASFPAFVVLFEMLLFKERIKQRELFLLISITIGLILVTPAFEFGNEATRGLLWGIFSGAIYAILAVFNRQNADRLSGSQASWWQYLFSILLLLPFSADRLPAVSAMDWLWIACIGVLCTSVAYTIFVSSLNTINARTAAMIISLEPVYAIVIAWLWLGETPNLRMIIGGSVILLSVAAVNFKK